MERSPLKKTGLGGAVHHEPFAARAALGPQASATLGFARLFVEFADANFLLDTAAFHQFAEAADCFLSRLSFAKR